jgi:hypothetical protein
VTEADYRRRRRVPKGMTIEAHRARQAEYARASAARKRLRDGVIPRPPVVSKASRPPVTKKATPRREIPRRPAFSSQWQPPTPPPESMPTAAQVALVLDAIRLRPLAALDVGRVSGLGYHDAFRTLELLVLSGSVARRFPSMYAMTGAARSQ